MRKLQSTKQSTKANTTISALQDAKKHLKLTPKNTSAAPHLNILIAAVAAVTAKPSGFS